MNEEMIQFLKDNLKIEIEVQYGVYEQWGNNKRNILEVKLLLNNEVISIDYETLENIKDE